METEELRWETDDAVSPVRDVEMVDDSSAGATTESGGVRQTEVVLVSGAGASSAVKGGVIMPKMENATAK